MERPSGPPLGAATQSTGRPLVENGVQMPAPLNTSRKLRHEASDSSLSSQVPISAGQVVALVRDYMKQALKEHQSKAAEASGVSTELKTGLGVTIDLSHKQIQRFPDEVIDIVKNEMARLALSHNQISTFSPKFAECSSLRYLNVRNNVIREIPPCIWQLSALEYLDLAKNKLRSLPPELARLTSLRVLSIERNRLEVLPLFLGDMASLRIMKINGNPLRFPPREILQLPDSNSPNGGSQDSSEKRQDEASLITAGIKEFLRQRAMAERSETESGGEESSEGTETPRPMKRITSGRFPIKVNGTELPDVRSPAFPRPPPIPSRSHYRGLSQQNTGVRRPGVQPLTIGNANERLRSNSESLLAATPARERSSDRSRRMGIVSKKPSELGTVEESKINRYSNHYRGLSHGSAMQANNINGNPNSRSPASPADSLATKSTYVRRLSSLPERKRESTSADPIVEAAKGILYALFQVHPLIQNLLGAARDGTNKRTSLERVFYNANTHIDELDRHIRKYMTYSDEDEELGPRSNENIHRACVTCVGAYMHVLGLLARNVDTLVENSDPRYLRTLLSLLYASTAEVRNASTSLFDANPRKSSRNASRENFVNGANGTVKFRPRDKSVTPTRDRPGVNPRIRSATVQHSQNLRVATDSLPPAYVNGVGRAATMTSATPRSGESFVSTTSSGRLGGDFSEEDRIFDLIFLRLQQSSELAIRTLPLVNTLFFSAMKQSSQQSGQNIRKDLWHSLIQKCQTAMQTAETLKSRLSLIKLKEPGIRTQAAFWELCNSFIQSYTDLAMQVKEAKSQTTLLPGEVIVLFRPLQKAIKETSQLIQTSPWSFLAAPQSTNIMTNGSYMVQSPASQMSLPMTPQSAALGPAVQATVPSTPQSASYNSMFSGNVFERADALLSMNGGSISSRSGTMTSMSTLGSHDSPMTPGSMLSPMHNFGSRYNSNGKVTF